jgi:hypothetical protein
MSIAQAEIVEREATAPNGEEKRQFAPISRRRKQDNKIMTTYAARG